MSGGEGSNWGFRKGKGEQEATIEFVIPFAVRIEIGKRAEGSKMEARPLSAKLQGSPPKSSSHIQLNRALWGWAPWRFEELLRSC